MTDSQGYLPDPVGPAPVPVVELGEQGAHVTEVQERLQANGYLADPPSGVLDEGTQAALQAFGADRGLAGAENGAIVAQMAVEQPLLSPVWQQYFTAADATYGYAANLPRKYENESVEGNTVWADQERKTTYYPDEAMAQADYGATVAGGRLVDVDGSRVDTTGIETKAGLKGSKEERMIYTMGGDGEFRVADPQAEQAAHPGERFHHSSLASGQPVAGAGEIKVRDGVVEAVSDKSGHYQPDFAMTQQVEAALAANDVDTNKVTFELGNFNAGGGADSETLVTGAELKAYDREAILEDLRPRCRAEAQAAAERKWGSTWGYLPQSKQAEEVKAFFTQAEGRFKAMSNRELADYAREILEGRHERLREVLQEIPMAMGWREDPLERHQWRWYDGQQWTEKVSDNDVQSNDYEGAELLSPGMQNAIAESSRPQPAPQPEAPAGEAPQQPEAAEEAPAQPAPAQAAPAQPAAQAPPEVDENGVYRG